MDGQISIFDYLNTKENTEIKPISINKPIRLIELFAGIGAQAKALERLEIDFEHYKISEWEVHACASYHQIHMPEDKIDYSSEYTDEEIVDKLNNFGISLDGKTPLLISQLQKKSECWHREVYNDFMATHNLGSITNLRGGDLGIMEKDKYCYILTYSFPCQ